ncbi:MAG: TrmH family RNA methyltransferase [Candidatus Bipolaricaulota bacterium]|nr:TrmH family RNA methyltransferase [Candidatus Bipolaricaulota bacterium]MCS7274731.1 TrmH family RNA methyltransferase [Candidatus Bipolaricaulota bacterium]MDW8110010.1 TrmH family RNA methyltransferase [Candidatus Bipolaricaulota bacterium]MDW8328918.1 TrmH family RNA methyltransferase [Candidatus Bipolaricaulota bacterium]
MAKKLYPKALRKQIPTPDDVAAIARQPIVFVLDNLQDTFNVGALFRVADAVAAERVYLCGWTPTPPNPRIHKAAVGTEHWVPWEYREDSIGVVTELKARGYKAMAIEQHPQSISYAELRESPPAVLIVGHETHGISAGVLECADLIVELPMLGVTRSLTVAAAAAVIAYKLLELMPERLTRYFLNPGGQG